METDSPVVYHGTTESRFPESGIEKKQASLNPEEMRILQECNRESFYYRCLPFAVAGMTGTYYAVKQGYLSAHPRWGPSLKMTGAAFIAWVLGKFSYRKTCEDKFVHLKNSQIGNVVRKKRGIGTETFDSEVSNTSSMFEEQSQKDSRFTYFSDNDYHSSSGSLNLDTDKNIQYSGLDDRERPSTDRENSFTLEEHKPEGKTITYNELRSKNREDFEKKFQKSEPSQHQESGPQRPWADFDTPRRPRFEPTEGASKNIYGDSWDNPKLS